MSSVSGLCRMRLGRLKCLVRVLEFWDGGNNDATSCLQFGELKVLFLRGSNVFAQLQLRTLRQFQLRFHSSYSLKFKGGIDFTQSRQHANVRKSNLNSEKSVE